MLHFQLAWMCRLLPVALLSGCAFWHHPSPLPPDVSDTAVLSRVAISPGIKINPAESVVKSNEVLTNAPDAEPTLFSLSNAVAYGRRNNPRLRSALAAIERARGQEQVAFAPFLPQVDILSQTGSTSNNQGPGSPGATGFLIGTGDGTHDYAQVELQLQWTLYDFGRTRSRYRQAIARERLAELQMIRVQQTIDFDVATAYFNVLLARAFAKVQEEAVQRAESILHDTNARRKNGVADRDDVLRSEVQLSESREAVVNAREAEFNAIARLNYVMGRNSGLPLQVVNWESRQIAHRPLAEYLGVAASDRPEIGVARQAVAVSVAGRDFRDAEFLPHVFTRASLGYVDGNNVRTGGQDGVGLHFNLPLFSGGRRLGELQSATADVAGAIADAQLILDSVSLEVNLAYRTMVAAGERIGLAQTSVAQSEENLRLVRVKYRNGTATPTDIVDAETSLTRSQQRYFSAMYSHTAAQARLAYAIGRPQSELLIAPLESEELPKPRLTPQTGIPAEIVPAAASGNMSNEPRWQRSVE